MEVNLRMLRWSGSMIAIGILVAACGSSSTTSDSVPTPAPNSTTRSTSTSTTSVDPSRLGRAQWWSDGRTGTADELDAAGVVVSFVGSPSSRAQDPFCGSDYVGVAEETPTEVIVTVHVVMSRDVDASGSEGSTACQAIGATRAVSVSLAAPVGDRIVRDGADGRTHELLAGPSSVTVEDIPEGYAWWSEGEAFLVDDPSVTGPLPVGWIRTWAGVPTERTAACPPMPRTIGVTRFAWPDPVLPPLPPGWTVVPSGPDDHGMVRSSRFDAGYGPSVTRIDRLRDGSLVRIEASAWCGPPPGIEELERVAVSTP